MKNENGPVFIIKIFKGLGLESGCKTRGVGNSLSRKPGILARF